MKLRRVSTPGVGQLPATLARQRRSRGVIIGPQERVGHRARERDRFQVNTYAFNAPTPAAGASRVVPANALRAYLLVQNKGSTTATTTAIFINYGTKASAQNGARIIPGGNQEFVGGGLGGAFVPLEDVYIVGATGGELCFIMEGVIVLDELGEPIVSPT